MKRITPSRGANPFRVALVVPNYRWARLEDSAFWHMTPYNLCMLAAAVRDVCEVQILDAYAADMTEDQFAESLRAGAPDLIGVTVMMDQCASAGHKAAGLAKSILPDTPVILGGVYPTVNPDQAMADRNVDYAMVGEGEHTLREFIGFLRADNPMPEKGVSYREGDRIVHTGRSEFIRDLDGLPLPAYDLIDFERYANHAPRKSVDGPRALPYARVITSRGCPVDCVFCQVKLLMGRKFRPRSAENVLAEIAWLKERYGVRTIIFDDDNLFTDRQRARDIFQGMIDRHLDVSWISSATAVFRLDEELLQLMRRSGCEYICIAIESGTERVLKQVIGKPVDYGQAKRMVRCARDLGIYVAANFIVGFPTETWDEIRQTIRFAEELDANYVKLFHAIPLRHTRLWDLCEKTGAFKPGFRQDDIRWSVGQIESTEFRSGDLTILRAYEWDRINFTDPEKRRRTAAMMSVEESELLEIRRRTLLGAQTRLAAMTDGFDCSGGAGSQNVLVVGADGRLGGRLAAHMEAAGNAVWRTTRRQPAAARHVTLDLDDEEACRQLPATPLSAAILCAGVTSIDRCHTEPERTARVNVLGTISLARALAARGVFVVYPSSNMVFDGAHPHRREDEPVCPRTEYGRQKALVEKELRGLGRSAAIVRFTKILGPETPLIREWIDALLAGREIHPFFDLVMAPVTYGFAAEVLERIARQRLSGVFHVSARQDVSYGEVARRLAERLGVRAGLVVPVSSQTRGLAAEAVPTHTTLDATRLRSVLNREPPHAWEAVDATFDLTCRATRGTRTPELTNCFAPDD